ncbi:MAG: cytochrome c biogenesis protein CcdA [Deltaproteobacteria bacterium]|nr:cytochrome c biogenesis protein CcdA [Deltaproteobacteria bacterium]
MARGAVASGRGVGDLWQVVMEFASHAPLAFAAGLLSVFSPCVMPLMPAYLSLISGISVEEMEEGCGDAALRARVIRACLGFVAGFSTVFIIMGIGAVAIGHTIRTWRISLLGLEIGIAQIAGVVIVLLGLHMTGLVRIPILYRDTRLQFKMNERSFLSTFLVGAGFALGWSPCIGPILSSVLALAGSRETVVQGTALLAIYSAGLAIPFLLAGWSIEYFFKAFARVKQHFRKLEVASGLMLMAVGMLLVTDQFTRLNSQFSFLVEFVTRAEQALQ